MKTNIYKTSKIFLESRISFYIILIFMIVSSTIICSLYFFNFYKINEVYFNEIIHNKWTNDNISIFFRLILTPIGSSLSIISLLLINRDNSNFVYYAIPATLMLTINSLVSQLIFDAIKWFCIFVILLTQGIIWKRFKNFKKMEIGMLTTTFIILMLLLFSLPIGIIILSDISKDSIFYNKSPILDPIQFVFTITGNIMMIMFILQSRIIYIIGNVLSMVMMILLVSKGDVLSILIVIQMFIYILITLFGYIKMKIEMKKVLNKSS